MKSKALSVAVVVGLLACFLTWLLMTDTSSPMREYLLQNPTLRNFWGLMIFPVMVVSALLDLPPSDIVMYPLVFAQWFGISYIIAIAVRSLVKRGGLVRSLLT